jgi:flavin-binding protein dodecin
MEEFEKAIKLHNLRQATNVDLGFDTPIEEIVKAEFSTEQREKLADKDEALPDGSFPIRNSKDLSNAIHAFGRAKDKDKAKAWIKRRAKELGKEGELPEGWEKALDDELEKAEDTIYKAFEEGLVSKDVFEKSGKPAQVGEVRTWHGVQMKKVSSTGNSEKDWQPVKGGEKGKSEGSGKTDSGKEDPGEPTMPSEDELKEHAKNSSEQALANAVKQSNNPTVRQVAQAEIKRRQSEEKPQDDKEKDVFPSKEVMDGGGKKTKDQSDNEKYQSARKDLKAKTGKEPSEGDATKEYDKRQAFEKESSQLKEKHKKELDTHNKEHDEIIKKFRDAMDKNEDTDKHTKALNDHNEKGDKMFARMMEEKEALKKKHETKDAEKKEGNKKPSPKDIKFIMDQLTNDEDSTDEEMINHFVKEIGMSEDDAKKWVAKRDKFLNAFNDMVKDMIDKKKTMNKGVTGIQYF